MRAKRWTMQKARKASPISPRFPLYIPTKGRSDTRLTSKALTAMGVKHTLVVEPQEVDAYVAASKGSLATVLELDLGYKAKYELCDDLGLSKSTGPGPARNFIWDHSIASGHPWHWVMDDNISDFYRAAEGRRLRVGDGACFWWMETFCLRYENIAMAGPNYRMFLTGSSPVPAFIKNTRIYSCNLIRNDVPFRWRGRYNEDTILSLDMLKAGWCTVQFNAFLQHKMNTQKVKGGNTAEFYAKEGTRAKSEMQVKVHPDVSRIAMKFGRVHHHVDYSPFKATKLVKKSEPPPLDGPRLSLKALK